VKIKVFKMPPPPTKPLTEGDTYCGECVILHSITEIHQKLIIEEIEVEEYPNAQEENISPRG